MHAICTVVGARPNFMKAAPIHEAFASAGVTHEIIHTGQHFDHAMSRVFFEELRMPEPSAYLGVGSGTHAEQTARVMLELDRVFDARPPRACIVVGDVNSTMAAALVASKRRIPVVHVEAGLRSFDREMPEELNRVVTDALADLLLTPSPDADENLKREGIASWRIRRVGNVMIDSLQRHLAQARQVKLASTLGLSPNHFALCTLHRPSNVDDAPTLSSTVDALAELSRHVPIVLPLHPRTRARLDQFDLTKRAGGQVMFTQPFGYLEFLSLMSDAQLILTDSGGIQEESTALGIPCLTLRNTTERPITVSEGTNTIVGNNPGRILAGAEEILAGRGKRGRIPGLWDGHAAERIRDAVLEMLSAPHVHLPEVSQSGHGSLS
ncbi:MAG: UDP-N-acetylglucosamine 2-epimerase (non-hydrolyzing) [Deltaproteobacteria bacterium]|nr:UDP-N-acetylglucosamine 2-epimerase (non-hydrolyzing) [Deltaproteobacteria bacterium]